MRSVPVAHRHAPSPVARSWRLMERTMSSYWTVLSQTHWRRERGEWLLDFWPTSGTWAVFHRGAGLRKKDVVRGRVIEEGIERLGAMSVGGEPPDAVYGVTTDDDVLDFGEAP